MKAFFKETGRWTAGIVAIFAIEIAIASRDPKFHPGLAGFVGMSIGAAILAIIAGPIAALSYRAWRKWR
jgi:hypothetical protein